jgi:NAD(P)-dependent dehydrogenase (short-subunit alcohol dehydrogenase family)
MGTAALAHELLPLGIRVNGIAPGLFPTEVRFTIALKSFFYSSDDVATIRWPLPELQTPLGLLALPGETIISFHPPIGMVGRDMIWVC